MAECFKCGQDMIETNGCDDRRMIIFTDGEEAEPIPFGESRRWVSYEERIESLERQIETGGRGDLSPEQVQEELAQFKDQWDEDEYNSRRCHDCGVKPGEYHHPGCDSEVCPRCGGQYFICGCMTKEKESIWGSSPEN